MDLVDYREELGIEFSDDQKLELFYTKIFNKLNLYNNDEYEACIDQDEYFNFCYNVGAPAEAKHKNGSNKPMMRKCMDIMFKNSKNVREFIFYYIAFTNSLKMKDPCNRPFHLDRSTLVTILKDALTESHIPFELLKDGDEYFVFPKGAPELDDALVSEPLRWLEKYPKARKTFCVALRQYQNGDDVRSTANNLRMALEEFLREFLGNDKGLNANKKKICQYLGRQNVDGTVSKLYDKIIDTYENIDNELVKQHDRLDPKLLEFMLYQTGLLIRMPLVVKQNETVDDRES